MESKKVILQLVIVFGLAVIFVPSVVDAYDCLDTCRLNGYEGGVCYAGASACNPGQIVTDFPVSCSGCVEDCVSTWNDGGGWNYCGTGVCCCWEYKSSGTACTGTKICSTTVSGNFSCYYNQCDGSGNCSDNWNCDWCCDGKKSLGCSGGVCETTGATCVKGYCNAECATDADCTNPAKPVCKDDCTCGEIVEETCDDSADCAGDIDSCECVDNNCVACPTDDSCGYGTCDTYQKPTWTCENGGTVDADCTYTCACDDACCPIGEHCEGGVCVPGVPPTPPSGKCFTGEGPASCSGSTCPDGSSCGLWECVTNCACSYYHAGKKRTCSCYYDCPGGDCCCWGTYQCPFCCGSGYVPVKNCDCKSGCCPATEPYMCGGGYCFSSEACDYCDGPITGLQCCDLLPKYGHGSGPYCCDDEDGVPPSNCECGEPGMWGYCCWKDAPVLCKDEVGLYCAGADTHCDCGGAFICTDVHLEPPTFDLDDPDFLPTGGQDFDIYCNVGKWLPDCIEAYPSTEAIEPCSYISSSYDLEKGWIKKFSCPAMSAGFYTARCVAIEGTAHKCCAGSTETNYEMLNSYPFLSWTGETNYTKDGLHPETGNPDSSFIYRIKYTDFDNDAPNFVKVHIKKGGIEITDSPFTMSAADIGDTDYTDGAIFYYTKLGLSAGTDYTYYFEAQDIHEADVTLEELDAPDVNSPPRVEFPKPSFSLGCISPIAHLKFTYLDDDGDDMATTSSFHLQIATDDKFETGVKKDGSIINRIISTADTIIPASTSLSYYLEDYDILPKLKYWWRVKVQDIKGAWSEWATSTFDLNPM